MFVPDTHRPLAQTLRRSIPILLACLALLLPPTPADAQPAPFPLEPGEAVATCFSGLNVPNNPSSGIDLDTYVLGAIDVRTPPAQGAVPGEHWSAPMFHNESAPPNQNQGSDVWTARNLGQVFGLALTDASRPDIFVTAGSAYFPVLNPNGTFADGSFGPLGPGGVYRLDGVTGEICEHAMLQNSGPALGNVAYDGVHDQIFVSSFEDGLVYRLPASSPCDVQVQPLETFDHGVDGRPAEGLAPILDDGKLYVPSSAAAMAARSFRCGQQIPDNGFTSLGRRVWGLQVFEGRLYYSVWVEHLDRVSANESNEIWSLGLLPGGDFDHQDVRRELALPPSRGMTSNPVSDIAFSADGRMLLAERVRCRDHGIPGPANAHSARVLEYERGPSDRYDQPVRSAPVGFYSSHRNSAGGVDFGYDTRAGESCDQTVWATGDALRLGQLTAPQNVYGLQGTPDENFSSELDALKASFFIDLDGDTVNQNKTHIGDVEIARTDCLEPPCLDQVTLEALCEVEDGSATGKYTWRFLIKNETDDPIHHLYLNDLDSNVSADPQHVVFDPPLRPNQRRIVGPITLRGAQPGDVLEVGLSIHDAQLAECCAETVTVELPTCECAQVVRTANDYCFRPFGPRPPYRYGFQVQNLSGRTGQYLFGTAVDPNDLMTPISPDDLRVRGSRALNNPVAPGGTTELVRFLIDGPDARPGEEVCLLLSLHDESFRECCSIPRCFTLPDCTINVVDPGDSTTINPNVGGLDLSFDGGVGGIDVEIPDTDIFAIAWAPVEMLDAQGAEIAVSTFDDDGDERITARAEEMAGAVNIHASFPQRRPVVRVEVLTADGSVVTSQIVRSDHGPVATLDEWPAGFIIVDNLDGITIVGHEDTYAVRLPDGSRAEGGLRIRSLGGSLGESFASASLRVQGLDELLLQTLAAAADCDGDGIPDDEAILRELVEDTDGDGVPDSCQDSRSVVVFKRP